MKAVVQRPRPHLWHIDTPTLGYSYPSAHAMNSLTLVAAVLLTVTSHRRWVVVIGSVYVVLVGVSRVWLGAHFPTDILGGWLLGLGWALLVVIAGAVIERRVAGSPSNFPWYSERNFLSQSLAASAGTRRQVQRTRTRPPRRPPPTGPTGRPVRHDMDESKADGG
jgi:hypothetical protein